MATVIDELVVKLGFDTKDVKKSVNEVQGDLKKTEEEANRTAKNMRETGKKAAEFFSQVRNSALAFFAVLTAGRGFASFTHDVVTSGAALNRLATNLNESVTTLSAWKNLTEQAGGSASGFEGTIRGLSQAAWDLANTGKSGAAPFLQHFKMDLLDSNRQLRPVNDLLLDIGDALKSVGNRQSAMHWASILGIDEGTFNVLMKSRPELERMLKWQREHAALTKKQGEEAQAAQEKWEKFKQELEGKMRPAVMQLLAAFERFSPIIQKLSDAAVPILQALAQMFINLDDATGGVSTKIIVLIGLFKLLGGGAILKGLASVAAGIAGIGAAGTTAVTGGLAAMLSTLGRIAGLSALVFHSENLNTSEADFIEKNAKKYGVPLPKGATVNPDGSVTLPPGYKSESAVAAPLAKSNASPDESALYQRLEKQYNLPAGLLAKIRSIESGKKINVTSPKGAQGPFQFMPKTAQEYGVKNPFDLTESATGAAKMFSFLLKRYNGNINMAVAAYNGGIGRVDKGIMYPEMRNYVDKFNGMVGAKATTRNSINSSSSPNNVSIGTINIQTQATDAKGISREIMSEIVSQSNSGFR